MDFNPEIVLLSLRNFTYSKKNQTLSAMASDFGQQEWLGLLYCDGFEKGIAIHSPKTGKTQHFFLSKRLMDKYENELQGWEFKPVPVISTVSKVVIFND